MRFMYIGEFFKSLIPFRKDILQVRYNFDQGRHISNDDKKFLVRGLSDELENRYSSYFKIVLEPTELNPFVKIKRRSFLKSEVFSRKKSLEASKFLRYYCSKTK